MRSENNKNAQNYLQIVCSSANVCEGVCVSVDACVCEVVYVSVGGCAKDVPLKSSESSLIEVNYIFIRFCSVIEIHWVEGALKVRLWIFMSMIRNKRLFRDNFPFPLAWDRINIVIIAVAVAVAFQCVASAWNGPLALCWDEIKAICKRELD